MVDEVGGASRGRGAGRKAKPKAKPEARAKAKPAGKPKAARRRSGRSGTGVASSASRLAKTGPNAGDARERQPGAPRRRSRAAAAKEESGAKKRTAAKAAPQASRRAVGRKPAKPADAGPVRAAGPDAPAAAVSEEERIESAKYLASPSQPRVFEEERFLFPESYGINRIRLHVKDPEWLFAHWDVNPESVEGLRAELGDRSMALSRLTLRVSDTKNGGESVILLPPGARSWYVRTAGGQREYRAELGYMLPSGEFRRLAESNVVVAPRSGPAPEQTGARRTYRQARSLSAAAAAAATAAEQVRSTPEDRPWSVPPEDAVSQAGPDADTPAEKSAPRPGGASDVFRR